VEKHDTSIVFPSINTAAYASAIPLFSRFCSDTYLFMLWLGMMIVFGFVGGIGIEAGVFED
jgi:hypothetical protein